MCAIQMFREAKPPYSHALTQIEAQRSGFDLERRSSGMSEFSGLPGNEGYEACFDVVEIVGIEPATSCLQGRRSPS